MQNSKEKIIKTKLQLVTTFTKKNIPEWSQQESVKKENISKTIFTLLPNIIWISMTFVHLTFLKVYFIIKLRFSKGLTNLNIVIGF